MKKLIFVFVVLMFSVPVIADTPGPFTGERNARGNYDGFDYEFWIQNRGENAEMTLTGGGTFECAWGPNVFNVLFRTGKKLGSTMTYHDYGDVTIEYAGEHNITSGSVSYVTVYGWTENPLVEYYILESRGDYKPPGTRSIGVIDLDDGLYEVFESLRVEQPSIHGTSTFPQYWSIRVGNRTEGTISVSEHFRAWEELGLDMSGTLWEVSMCIEGYQSSGNARLTRFVLNIGDEVYGADVDVTDTPEIELPEPEEPGEEDVTAEETVEENIEEAAEETAEDSRGFVFWAVIIIVAVIIGGVIIFLARNS